MANNVVQFSTGWDDQQGIVGTALVGNAQWTLEQIRDTGHIIPYYRHDQDDFTYMIIQLPHRYVGGSQIRLHVHAIPEALPVLGVSDKVYWSYSYFWANVSEVVPALVTWSSGFITTTLLAADQYKHQVYPLLNITKTGTNESSILLIKLTRLGTNVLDTYNVNKALNTGQANFGVLYFDVHFQANKIGTILEATNS